MQNTDFSNTAGATSFSKDGFRQALGMFATGVTVVTACSPSGKLVGLTANSFNSVSLQPPLVLWSLSSSSASMEVFSTVSHYAIHILASDQKDLALQFAAKVPDRFAGVNYSFGTSGTPLLQDVVATFECKNRSRYAEGDHIIFVGEVERCCHQDGASPLLYHGGKFFTEHPL